MPAYRATPPERSVLAHLTALWTRLARRREPCAAVWRMDPYAGHTYLLISAWTITAGALLLYIDPARTAGAAYRLINLAGGVHWVGALLLATGIALVAGPWLGPRTMRWALLADATVHLIITVSYGEGLVRSPTAGPLGAPAMLLVLLWCISQAERYRTATP